MKIAIVGGGIAGVTLAWLLSDLAEVELYEKSDRLGGGCGGITITPPPPQTTDRANHSNQPLKLEQGLQLFYPYYHKRVAALLEYLGIYTETHTCSYHSAGFTPFNLASLPVAGLSFTSLSPVANHRVKSDLKEFFKSWQTNYKQGNIPINLSLRQYTSGLYIRTSSEKDAIYPLLAALWSYPLEEVVELSANKFIKFINQSRLLDAKAPGKARYIPEGLDKYISKLLFKGSFTHHLGRGVERIRAGDNGVGITDSQRRTKSYDKVVLACGKQSALEILDSSINSWRSRLEKVQQVRLPYVIHQDERLLRDYPAIRRATLTATTHYTATTQDCAYHYNLSRLYKLDSAANTAGTQAAAPPYIMTLLPQVYKQHKYELKRIVHQGELLRPHLGSVTQRSYRDMGELQGTAGIYYCSDGFNYDVSPLTGEIGAALDLAQLLGVQLPFQA